MTIQNRTAPSAAESDCATVLVAIERSRSSWVAAVHKAAGRQDPAAQLWGATHGWHLQGDNPKTYADQWFTYRHQGNHGLIRAALAGAPLDPPRPDRV